MPLSIQIALCCLVLVAAVYDLRFRRIPNWLSLSGLVLGLGLNTLFGGVAGLAHSLLGLLCALGLYVVLYLLRAMGAGDVKLMAAVGALVGPRAWLEILLATALVGGIVSLLVVARERRLNETLARVALIAAELLHLRAPSKADARLDVRDAQALRLPHGAVIAAGSIVFLLGASLTRAYGSSFLIGFCHVVL